MKCYLCSGLCKGGFCANESCPESPWYLHDRCLEEPDYPEDNSLDSFTSLFEGESDPDEPYDGPESLEEPEWPSLSEQYRAAWEEDRNF